MRTNIDIDEKALKELMALTGAKTMKEAVNNAVRDQLRQQRAIDVLRSLRGKVEWEGDLDAMRRDRF
ncbi:type II toxin-antitoxin system VapB family antitoxin [Mesorhizobium sp. LHD-90]|uniref:type II toxin-antitoxin system VapB family antitoxin n=1 Tax=Mesorhizobium sp. LHD-90 TaxID=3071414 RepID=UPI0027E12B36|nr:type II toxin-antitoxin system VapB family antitoxin [Mesorhizobium sp. LHD-90]MDQ6434323.1 type II toxin-antitoxin system VapB family antitoxin [Mesorhizobium sp. LHD-90]